MFLNKSVVLRNYSKQLVHFIKHKNTYQGIYKINTILAYQSPHVSFFQCCLKTLAYKNSLSSPLPEIEIITLLLCRNHWASNTELRKRTVTCTGIIMLLKLIFFTSGCFNSFLIWFQTYITGNNARLSLSKH